MKKKRILAALVMSGALSVTALGIADVYGIDAISFHVSESKIDQHTTKVKVDANSENGSFKDGKLDLKLPKNLRVASTTKSNSNDGKMSFELVISDGAGGTVPITGDEHSLRTLALMLSALVAAGGGIIALRSRGKKKHMICLVVMAGAVTMMTLTGGDILEAHGEENWTHNDSFKEVIHVGDTSYDIEGVFYYNLETPTDVNNPQDKADKPAVSDSKNEEKEVLPPDTKPEKPGQPREGEDVEKPVGAEEPSDNDQTGGTEKPGQGDGDGETSNVNEAALASLAKINENPMSKMQLAMELEKEDMEANITADDLAKATNLNLDGMELDDYKFLELATDLDSLSLGYNLGLDDEGLQSIRNLTKLHKLVLDGTNITDLSPLSNLNDLEVLDIAETNVSSLEPIKGLLNIKELTAYELCEDEPNQVFDFSALSNFTKMEKLDVTGVNLSDIDFVKKMPNLQSLTVDETGISSLESLRGNIALTELRASGNEISDVSPISGLTGLTTLELNNNNIVDISPLADLTSLQTVELVGNAIEDISALGGKEHLTSVRLDKNRITNIMPLYSDENLESIRISDNNLNSLMSPPAFEHLRNLEVRGNHLRELPITHITSLEYVLASDNNIDVNGLLGFENFWNESGRTILMEDEIIDRDVNRKDADSPIELKGAGYNYTVSEEGFSINDEGQLVIGRDAVIPDTVTVNFAIKTEGDGEMLGSYNKKYSGKINFHFTGERKTILTVVSASEIPEVTVTKGASKIDWTSQLPTEIELTLSDGSRRTVSIRDWKANKVNTWQVGDYKATAVYDLPENVQEDQPVTATIHVEEKKVAEPKVVVDSTKTYYYHNNPVIELKNFDAIVSVTVKKLEDTRDKTLRAGIDYVLDKEAGTITIKTDSIYHRISKTFGQDERLELSINVDGKDYGASIDYHRYGSLYFTEREKDVAKGSAFKLEFISDDITKADLTVKAIEDFYGMTSDLGTISDFSIVHSGEKEYLVIPYSAVEPYISYDEVIIQISSDSDKFKAVKSDIHVNFKKELSPEEIPEDDSARESDIAPETEETEETRETGEIEESEESEDSEENTSSGEEGRTAEEPESKPDAGATEDSEEVGKPLDAVVVEREDDGSYMGDPIYPYDGATTIKINVSGDGLTNELLKDKSNVTIKVQSEGKEEFETNEWYGQNSNGNIQIRIKTGSLEKEVAYSARSPYPRTTIKIKVKGYEEKTVYVRLAI